MDPKIFKKYDIRGRAEGPDAQITPAVARDIGLAFGTYLQRFEYKNQAVVGRDNRRSSYTLSRSLSEGLQTSGVDVIDIDLVATPVVYWNAVRRGDIGGVSVTGSHLGPEQNGFKLCVGNRNIFGAQLKLMRSFIQARDLTYGDGKRINDHSSYLRYVEDVTRRTQMARPLRVVVDAGNGIGGLFAQRLMQGWGHELLECLFCQPDGSYPNHPPNPQEAENMRALGDAVRAHRADIGIAFDGDADRMGVVDERGEMIAADRVLALLARDMLSRHPGATVVADVLCSQVLFDEVRSGGGKAIMSASGHSLVKARMQETKALLGGEMSGHIFLGEDYYHFDDGFFAAGRVLQILAASDQSLSELDNSLPRLFSTPEYRPSCPDDAKFNIIEQVKAKLAGQGRVVNVDGIRIQFERGWGLLRASNTEPVLSLRFEAETEADALQYRDLFIEALRDFPVVGPVLTE